MSDVTTEAKPAKTFNPEAFAMNLAKAMESSGKALAAYLKPRDDGEKDKVIRLSARWRTIGCRTKPAPLSCR